MNLALGIGLKVVSTLAFTLMSACVKLVGGPVGPAGESYPLGQVVFARAFFALIPVFAWLWWTDHMDDAWRTQHPAKHLGRGMVGAVGMFFGFAALIMLPLADATAISYAAPIFTVVLAAVVLKEVVRIYRWSAVAAGFVGVLIMLSPHLGSSGAPSLQGAVFGLIGAFSAALATILVRRMTHTETTASIVFYFMVLCAALSLATLPLSLVFPRWGWLLPSPRDAALLVLTGIMGGIGQITLTESFRQAEASTVAPFDYLAMIWAVIVGWFLFGELPQAAVIAGSVIVIAAGLFVIYRERQLGLDRARQQRASPPRAL